MRKVFILLLLILSVESFSQNDWEYEVRIGINIRLNQSIESWNYKFPGLSVFASGVITKRIGNNFQLNYGHSLSFYHKSLGNNLNPLDFDIQIDFVNSFGFGVGNNNDNKEIKYNKYLRTLNNSSAYNLKHSFDNSLFVSTNLVLNNHGRNQAIGSITATIGDFSINYYNDGAIPINILPISDNFDRWWTGGINILIHSKKEYNIVEFSFDQFTGYNSVLYELSTIFGLKTSKYDYKTKSDVTNRNYNSSSYNLRIALDKNTHFDIGINGSLKWNIGKEEKSRDVYFGLQDIIHILNNRSLHPNNDVNKVHFGINYSNSIYNVNF